MCGISGILNFDHSKPADAVILQAMTATLQHRGPNDEGLFFDGHVGFGVRRLAIIDVAGGHQPITNEDGGIAVALNGEIYNFRNLRDELVQAGHRFRTNSDTEVIAHGYEQWGDAVLSRLIGMFALSVWDRPRHRLLLARDRMGEKPLFWHRSPEALLWGSEAKAILVAPWVDRRISSMALHHYLTLQYTPDPLTILEGINQLPAGHKLVVEGDRAAQVSRWWQLEFEPKWSMSSEETLAEARTRLEIAVKRCLVSEVPLGAFLSGGVDSSVVVALMARLSSLPVQTFSIGFEEPGFSEASYARLAADYLKTRHHEFRFSSADLVRTIESAVGAADGPIGDPAALTVYELARQASGSVTVALTGDGGDETLGGYMRYPFDRLLAAYGRLPSWVTGQLVPRLVDILPESTRLPEDRNPVAVLKRLAQFAAVTPKASLVRWGSYFSHDQKRALYADRWRDELSQTDTADLIASYFDEAHAATALDRTLSAEHATYLAGDLLPKTDRMTMTHSLEARAPFLDSDWVEWTARLPMRYKVRRMTTKWLLRRAFEGMVPTTLLRRGKQGFSVPIGHWLRGPLKTWCRDRLIDNQALSDWFRPTAIRQLLDEHHSGRINHGKRLWALLMFAVWLDVSRRRNPHRV